MKIILFIFIIILLIAAYGGYVVYHIQSDQKHATNPTIVQMPMVFGNGVKHITYIAAGDSTAVGQGASNVTMSYPYKVAEYLASEGATVHYSNVAVGGAKTQDVIAKQLAEIIAANPDIITISIGANDMTHFRTNASILKNDTTIINTLLEKTKAQIYITNIPNFYAASILPGWYRQILEFKIELLNPELRELTEARVHIVDIHDFGWSHYPDLSKTISSDHFHPNDIGYQNWTNAFTTTMKENGQ
jgi:lysophospholipase L1-like esterase